MSLKAACCYSKRNWMTDADEQLVLVSGDQARQLQGLCSSMTML